ncbi:MAG: hypothetical protein M3256_26925, partial [Actinomycetota bacterium]|nr:hypothetical protein [Actinomycetota bacterium]
AALPAALEGLLGILPLPLPISSSGAHLVIGRVSGRPNAVSVNPPVVPIAGFPVAGGTVAIIGVGLRLACRRRASNLASV